MIQGGGVTSCMLSLDGITFLQIKFTRVTKNAKEKNPRNCQHFTCTNTAVICRMLHDSTMPSRTMV